MPEINVLEKFGSRLFDDRVMKQRLPQEIYEDMRKIRDEGMPWIPEVADVVADAMKTWAMELGATHYIHWFSPLSGNGAGKHEGFIDGVNKGEPMLSFSGKMLSQSETDASSFPSGGLRATFEARGYTTWDPTSPAFVLGTTLYIPTAFCSYTSVSLDQKTPVLRSMQALNKQALRVLRALGDNETISVTSTVGAEQEYFLVDRKLYNERIDLKVCKRTVFGAKPPKGQQMDDHYFGTIPERVRAFMRELDLELWRLGVPAKTEHNEVAPGQFELANVYATANIACDHNQLTMELMEKVAVRHNLTCILHEKPFAGVNGSGKHDNWSLVTNNGKNLLSPGKTPKENPKFLLFLMAVCQAVDEYADLLRLSASCPGNDYRLGGGEAPPAIISIFLGEQLKRIIHCIAHEKEPDVVEAGDLLTGVKSLPLLKLDDNDRNRTSPFAFTGNKFEFRMVGSSQSIGLANAVINAAVADTLRQFADFLEKAEDKQTAMYQLIADSYRAHKKIIFNGNNYSQEWLEEAKARNLTIINCMVDAIPAFKKQKNIDMFARTKVFSVDECQSRYEIMNEQYVNTVQIEANVMLQMSKCNILPSANIYLGKLSGAYTSAKQAGVAPKSVLKSLKNLSAAIDKVSVCVESLEETLNKLPVHAENTDSNVIAKQWYDFSVNQMANLRTSVDELELLIDEKEWPLPSYNDLLFDL